MARLSGRIERVEQVLGLHANFVIFLCPAWAVVTGRDPKDLTNRVLVFAGPRSEALRKKLVESYREVIAEMDRRRAGTKSGASRGASQKKGKGKRVQKRRNKR